MPQKRPSVGYIRIVFLERLATVIVPLTVLAAIALMVAGLFRHVSSASLTALSYLVWVVVGLIGGIAGGSGLSAWGGGMFGGGWGGGFGGGFGGGGGIGIGVGVGFDGTSAQPPGVVTQNPSMSAPPPG